MKITLEGLRDWLKTQSPTAKYDWWDREDCLLMRYAKSQGFKGIYADLNNDTSVIAAASGCMRGLDKDGYTYADALRRTEAEIVYEKERAHANTQPA